MNLFDSALAFAMFGLLPAYAFGALLWWAFGPRGGAR